MKLAGGLAALGLLIVAMVICFQHDLRGWPRAVQFLTSSRHFEGRSDIESGAPSGVLDVVATVGAQEIIGEGA